MKFLNRRGRRERGELKERKEPDSASPQRPQRTLRLYPAGAWFSVVRGQERMKLEYPRNGRHPIRMSGLSSRWYQLRFVAPLLHYVIQLTVRQKEWLQISKNPVAFHHDRD